MTDEKQPKLISLLQKNTTFRTVTLIFSLLSIPLSLLILWYAWWKILPALSHWGFEPLSWWKAILAAIGIFFMAFLPLGVPTLAVQGMLRVLGFYAEAEATKTAKSLDRGSTELATVEEELKEGDVSGLVLLLRYSRVQLEAYYRIGLTQTQRSFRYGVVAMWIGFIVVLIGIAVRVVDLTKIGLKPPDSNVTTLVILAGAVIEVVSALFLWVYRKSVKQLTYFYDRQMYNHTVLMCHRMAETMQTSSDDVKKEIVQKVLDKAWTLEQDALPQGTALLSFGGKGQAAGAGVGKG